MRTELIGREREFAVLADSLAAALEGDPRLVLCRGEPGIGKTRLAEELCRWAGTQHVSALWGRAADSAGAPPYWPWRQILRAASTIVDLTAIADELRLTQDLGPLAPDVFAGAVDPADGTASIDDRFHQFNAVRSLLREVSLRRPLVIVLDDLHSADQPSLLLPQHSCET